MLCLLKPIHWNTAGYVAPAGHLGTSGFPKDFGYGHEEWNNSPRMRIQIDGQTCRALYTLPVSQNGRRAPGDTLLLMYASHNGRQQLVGIAGSSRYLSSDEDAELLDSIKKKIGTKALWRDAWKLPVVRQRFTSETEFRDHWKAIGELTPNWICPEHAFLWLDEPLDIDPQAIRGTSKLNTMFSSFTKLPAERAAYIMDAIPLEQRNAAWEAIRESLEVEAASEDIQDVRKTNQIDETTRKTLIDARLGQGRFRTELMHLNQRCCALTGSTIEPILRASHIRPWRESTNEERLDPNNGLLLAAHADALFDRYLISFDDKGQLLLTDGLSEKDLEILGLHAKMRIQLRPTQRVYMAHHRQEFKSRSHSTGKTNTAA